MLYDNPNCYNSTYWKNFAILSMIIFFILLLSILFYVIYSFILKKKSKKIKLITLIVALVSLVSFIGIMVYEAIERPPIDHYCWSTK